MISSVKLMQKKESEPEIGSLYETEGHCPMVSNAVSYP